MLINVLIVSEDEILQEVNPRLYGKLFYALSLTKVQSSTMK